MEEEDIEKGENEEEDLYLDPSSRCFNTYEEIDWICNQNQGVVKGIKL